MKNEFFSHSDGTLAKRPIGSPVGADWTDIRTDYRKHFANIETGRQLRACLREGKYTFPGGYPLYFVTSDGGVLSFEAVRDNLSSVIWSIRNNVDDGWRVVGMDICYGSDEPYDNVYCDDTGKLIA